MEKGNTCVEYEREMIPKSIFKLLAKVIGMMAAKNFERTQKRCSIM
jgi:hypothetical protein